MCRPGLGVRLRGLVTDAYIARILGWRVLLMATSMVLDAIRAKAIWTANKEAYST